MVLIVICRVIIGRVLDWNWVREVLGRVLKCILEVLISVILSVHSQYICYLLGILNKYIFFLQCMAWDQLRLIRFGILIQCYRIQKDRTQQKITFEGKPRSSLKY